MTALIAVALLAAADVVGAQSWGYSYDLSGNDVRRALATNQPPRILKPPQSTVVGLGELASFSVVMEDTSALAYQWLFYGTNLTSQTRDALLLVNVTVNQQGPYSVVITNSSGSVTSSVANLYLDTDGDGLPDSWELPYFGSSSSQRSGGDADGDGISNLQEFYDGTNPTNRTSFHSLLTVLADGGQVTVTPAQTAYDLTNVVTLTGIAFPPNSFYSWTGDLLARTNPAALTMNTNKTVVAHFRCTPAPLGMVGWWRAENDALDALGANSGWLSNGLSFATGQVGQAFLFNASNQEVRAPPDPRLRIWQFQES
jgi:hypothetical protein